MNKSECNMKHLFHVVNNYVRHILFAEYLMRCAANSVSAFR